MGISAGTLQQQAAAAGAVQALAYSSDPTASLASTLTGHGVVQPLVGILMTAPAAIRCAAAGALCNLAIKSRAIQVFPFAPLERHKSTHSDCKGLSRGIFHACSADSIRH